MSKWLPYKNRYEKRYYDIKLKDGRVFNDCWPNAGCFHALKAGRCIEGSEVAEIKKVNDPFFRNR